MRVADRGSKVLPLPVYSERNGGFILFRRTPGVVDLFKLWMKVFLWQVCIYKCKCISAVVIETKES